MKKEEIFKMKRKEWFKLHKAVIYLSCIGAGSLVFTACPLIVNEALRDKTDYNNEYHIPGVLKLQRTDLKIAIDPTTSIPVDIVVPLVAPNTPDQCWNILTTQRFLDDKWECDANIAPSPIASLVNVTMDWNQSVDIWNHSLRFHFKEPLILLPQTTTVNARITYDYMDPVTANSVLPDTEITFVTQNN